MKRVCAWCQVDLEPSAAAADERVTHGICPDCTDYFFGDGAGTLQDLLDRLEAPVLLTNGDGVVELANRQAQQLLGKTAGQMEGRLGGEVMECAFARLPGGCGRSVHCQACTVRNSVRETLRTGRGLEAVPAYQDLITPRGVRRTRMLISTERRAELVLLRIDELAAADDEAASGP